MTTSKILLQFDPEPKNILSALKAISEALGCVCQKDAQIAADYFNVSLSKIYETASFFDLVGTEKPKEILIQVCDSANCMLSGANDLVGEIENTLRIKAGDDNHPKIKLETVSCLGRCGEGPIVVVNGKIYTQVDKGKVHEILKEWMQCHSCGSRNPVSSHKIYTLDSRIRGNDSYE